MSINLTTSVYVCRETRKYSSPPPPHAIHINTLNKTKRCLLFLLCLRHHLSFTHTGGGEIASEKMASEVGTSLMAPNHHCADQAHPTVRLIASRLPWYTAAYSPHDVPRFFDITGVVRSPPVLCTHARHERRRRRHQWSRVHTKRACTKSHSSTLYICDGDAAERIH